MKKVVTILFFLLIVFHIEAQTTIIVATGYSGYSNQAWRSCGSGNAFDKETVKKYWNEDRYITSAAWTSHGWFYAMNKGVKWTDQSYMISSNWPDDFVHEYKQKGYMITSLASSDSNFLVVVSKNTGITDQQICAAPWSNLKDWIKQWWDKGYRITSIACKSGLWTVIMSKTNMYKQQAYMWANSADDISNKLKEYWDKGYIITALEYGGGEFFCIMSTTDTSAEAGQSKFIKSSEDPKSFIDEAWNKGWCITYIGG